MYYGMGHDSFMLLVIIDKAVTDYQEPGIFTTWTREVGSLVEPAVTREPQNK